MILAVGPKMPSEEGRCWATKHLPPGTAISQHTELGPLAPSTVLDNKPRAHSHLGGWNAQLRRSFSKKVCIDSSLTHAITTFSRIQTLGSK